MSAVDDILSQINLSQLAGKLGTDEQTAEAATRGALPALLGGLQANAADPAGAASISEAVGQHDPSLVEGGVDLDQVDPRQGNQIVSHIFGGNTNAVTDQLAGAAGGQSDLVQRLLPMLAPIVMSYLAKRMLGGGAGGQGGVGDVLGGLLGGGGAGGALGGLLGGQGGPGGQQGGGIGDVLGGLLGGGRR